MNSTLRITPVSLRILFLAPLLVAAVEQPAVALDLQDCELTGANGSVVIQAECAHLQVPEDHAAPDGRQINLYFARIPARSREPAPDPLIFFAGGPGQSATESYPLVHGALSRLNSKRDIWLLDQRGTGQSTPLPCAIPPEVLLGESSDELMISMARNCRTELEADGTDLRQYTTTDAARDVETVRLLMGSPQLNLVGGSYGTRMALRYLHQYPDAVRSVVLDSVVPPEVALGQDHARHLDDALEQLFALCQADAACAERYGDPAASLAQLRKQLRAQPLRMEIPDPVTHQPVTEIFNHDALAGLVRLYSYGPESAALLPLLIDEALQGRAGPLLAQGRMLVAQMVDAIYYGMQLSVSCAEDAQLLEIREQDNQRLIGNELVRLLKLQCAQWPIGEAPADFHAPASSEHPVLLLSGELDPVTPPAYAERVHQQLPNSRHLIAPGQGHIAMTRGCMSRLLDEFVTHLQPDELDAACLQALSPPAFFLDYLGTAP